MKLGTNDIVNVQLGSNQVNKIYQGSNLVWEYNPPVFEFSVKTDNAGVSTSTQFRMPLTTSTGLNMKVDWGDGSPIETITNHTLAIHDYGTAGTYTISVTGSILGWRFNQGGDRLKMLDVKQWSGLNISINAGFSGCTNLTASATDAPLITTTNFTDFFLGCSNFNGEIGNWDTSNVTIMDTMFTSSSFNKDISTKTINAGLPNEYVAWDVSNVTSMYRMFGLGSIFNNNIGNWDVSNVTNMRDMFTLNSFFNQDISSWNVSNVTNMNSMFRNTPFNQDIGSWDVSNVTNMNSMLRGTPFNKDISNWDINQVTNFIDFMTSSTGLSTANYDALLVGWEAQAPIYSGAINFGGSKYTLGSAAATARASLISTYGWTITDGGGI